jgi:hypothetical protein
MSTILFLGSSHLYAMQGALESAGLTADCTFKFLQDFRHQHRIAEQTSDGAVLFEDVAAWLTDAPEPDHLVVQISGSDWLRLCLTERTPPIDFVLPARPDLPLSPGAFVSPFREVEARLSQQISHVLDGIEALGRRERGLTRRWYLQAPPPVRGSERIAAYLAGSSEAWLKSQSDLRPTSEWLRFKFCTLHHELVKHAAEKAGFTHLPTPATVVDHEGFLQESLIGDVMHGNFDYGRRMLAMIVKLLEV